MIGDVAFRCVCRRRLSREFAFLFFSSFLASDRKMLCWVGNIIMVGLGYGMVRVGYS